MPESVVWTSELSRSFGDAAALQNITFSLPAGRIMTVVGPNGSGKSTLIRILLGLLRPDQGQVRVLGLDPFTYADTLRPRIGALLEARADPGSLTVLESLQSSRDLDAARAAAPHTTSRRQQSSATRAARVNDLLYQFDLWHDRYQRVVDMSHSSREKLLVANTLAARPSLLLLDQPLATLDMDHRLATLGILRDIVQADGSTLLFTTNNLEDAEAVADQILILFNGQAVIQGTPDSLMDAPAFPMLEITGRGFSDEVVALVQRRPEVAGVVRHPHRLLIRFNRGCDTAPLVSLLVESSADIDEVHKRRWDLHARYHQLLATAAPLATTNGCA